MARDTVKVNTTVSVPYKIPRGFDLTDKTVKMDVYDEADALVVAQSGAMVAMAGSVFKFRKDFTPNTEGHWHVECYVQHDTTSDKEMTLIREYNVGQYSVAENGARLATIESKIDALPASDPPMIG